MAFHSSDLVTLLGVVAIVLAVLLYLQRSKVQPKQEEASGGDQAMLCTFAIHEGTVVGETVAFAGDALILKQAGVFKSVPAEQAKLVDGEVVLDGAIDWAVAESKGAEWHAANTAGHDPGVSQELTKSEDVRAPALDAFRERQAAMDDSSEASESDLTDDSEE